MRHARTSRAGIALLALLGAGQAAATLTVAVALTLLVAGDHRWATALLAGAFAARAAFSWGEQLVAQRTAARVTDELRRAMLAAVLRRGPAWVASFGAGRLTAVLTNGLDALRPWFSGYLPSLVLGVALPPLVIVTMALVDPASAVVALVTLPLIPVLGALIGWATQSRARQRWQADARLAGHFLDVVRGLPALRVFGRAERQTEVVADLTDKHRSATLRVLRVAFLSSTALDLVGTLSVGLIAVEAGLRVAAGNISLGPALLVILLAPEAYRPLREMAAKYHAATDATAVINDVDEILTSTPPNTAPGATPAAPATSAPSPISPAGLASAISPASETSPAGLASGTSPASATSPTSPTSPASASSATSPASASSATSPASASSATSPASASSASSAEAFSSPHDQLLGELGAEASGLVGVGAFGLRVRYPGTTRDALTLDELTVRAGEIVALRGPSGAGKTTALRVLAGLQAPQAGVAVADNAHYLPQRVTLPHARTVADLFPSGSSASDISDALRTVGLDLPADTPLGERGAGVSAGQRHRLALAALLHRAGAEPVTLLLDEPTAHLDATTEQLVIDRLRTAARLGSAVLVVAHRPALLAAADRITDVTPPAEHSPTASIATAAITAGPAPAGAASAGVPTAATLTTAGSAPARTAASAGTSTVTAVAASAIGSGAGDPATTTLSANTSRRASAGVRAWVAVVLGSGSSLAGLVLTGAAAWLLVRASSLPPVLSLSTAVVLVRGSAVTRPLLRYLERLVAHDVAFARLGAWRSRVYAALIPLVPGPRLRRRGDLLTKVVDDVDARVDGLLRGRLPAWAALATIGIASGVALLLSPAVAVPLAAGLVIAGVPAPMVAARQATRSELATGEARAQLRDAMVETVDGIEELTGSQTVPERRSRELARLEEQSARAAGWAAALGHLGWGITVTGTVYALGGLSHEWAAVLLLCMVVLGEQVMTLPDAAVARRRAAGAEQRLATLLAEPPAATFPRHGRPIAGPPAPQLPRSPSNVGANKEGSGTDASHPSVTSIGTSAKGTGADTSEEGNGVDTSTKGSDADTTEEGSGVDTSTKGGGANTNEGGSSVHTNAKGSGVHTNAKGSSADTNEEGSGTEKGSGTGTNAKGSDADTNVEGSGTEKGGGTGTSAKGNGVGRGGPLGVRLQSIVAGWDPDGEAVLDGLDLDLVAGARIAVLGRSGAGKSTLAAVVGRLLDPRAGALALGDGSDLRELPEEVVRGRIVLVGDETDHVFASTVRENLRLARPGATDGELRAVLERVRLGEWLDGLAAGLDTWLGSGGSTMSGGQVRRFATARALLAEPGLLILDEPTEGLDADVAEALMADLLAAGRGRTVLVLTHRTEGLDLVDRVLMLEGGGLTEVNDQAASSRNAVAAGVPGAAM
ncbi:ATP-binding cassette, subfamily C, CydCD [Paractinoplanes atraurantiacus]|uniref:ATP-binding cassette, subfamily C, CydCD n=1 Tax=Paractinoplanes atraurantiacus TaxID=1036182 RepID=A0A285IMJ6_9ACTN|nr:ATP-binding cassette domain-containing protein [Actinoplanes atraurantiacus]SNY49209.1 ATP-binding cassette, subfamily C, CydCD [Actinoplanes atraurantiacus]